MNVTVNENGVSKVAVITGTGLLISSTQDALDLMATLRYQYGCSKMVLGKEAITENFFDLKTRIAGEILQKFTNYGMKVAIVGDFGVYTSKSLKDFIFESNNGRQVFFMDSEEAAVSRLHSV